MALLSALILIILAGYTCFLTGLAFFAAALYIFIAPFDPDLGGYLLLALIVLGVPLCAYLVGLILDLQALGPLKAKIFGTFALGISLALTLESGQSAAASAALGALQAGKTGAALVSLLHFADGLLYTAGIGACALLLMELVVEFPLHWVNTFAGGRLDFRITALRPLLLVLLAALSFDLLLDMFTSSWQLSLPAALVR